MSILQSIENGVATLTLNRPESRNALNLAMCDGIIEAIGMTASGKVQKRTLSEHALKEFGRQRAD